MEKEGFTLIELAIVLVVIGILMGIGAGMVGLVIKRVHYNQNQERLAANVESLIGYALTHHGRLPSADNCSQYLRNTKDVWGKDFVCVTADELVSDGACARRTTSLEVEDDNDNTTHNNIAFVLISGGPNYNVQTSNSTPHIYTPETPNIDDYKYDMDRPEPYDDMVRYVSLDELKAKLNCPYTEAYLRILNNELPYGFAGSSYNATVYAAGGVPFSGDKYKWCVEDQDGLTATGITVDCGGNNPVNDNCSAATWPQCRQLNLSGSSNSTGTYKLNFFVRDADNNAAEKSLALTINPTAGGGGGGCTSYEVYNKSGSTLYWNCSYFGCLFGSCTVWKKNKSETLYYGPSVTIRDVLCKSDGTISYSSAQATDANGNCKVYYLGHGTLSDDK